MKLTFEIDYHTNWGEHIHILGECPELGGGNIDKAPVLAACGYSLHKVEIEVSPALSSVDYRYVVKRDDGTTRNEWGPDRHLVIDANLSEGTIVDSWQDPPADRPFYSSAFTEAIFNRKCQTPMHSLKPSTLQISVEAPHVESDCMVAIVGSNDALGNWNPAKAIPMNSCRFPIWSLQLMMSDFAGQHVEYKFVLMREYDRSILEWEDGENRTLDIAESMDNHAMVINGLRFRSSDRKWRGTGVAIPVFSLRSDKDCGVGDFADIKELVDWAVDTGQKIIQLLPINDTTMTGTNGDSYPYNAITCFGLHPMYLRVREVGELSDRKEQSHYDAWFASLNKQKTVDYESVNRAKNEYMLKLFRQQGESDMQLDAFKKFVDQNSEWLTPYAAFCTLRDLYGTADMSAWVEYAVYTPSRIHHLSTLYPDRFQFVYFVQFHLDRQLKDAVRYAHSRGVAIKGDIPIGISRNSVDAWMMPELFNLDWSAGAPPDDFAVMGQNWGFPTYNWERMAVDGFAWWKSRLKKMAEYFDAYRIDHVLGFFRIWQIPRSAIHGLLGIFNPALPLSAEEMSLNYGFEFNERWMTRPYIADWMLGDVFGDLADRVKSQFLLPAADNLYSLREEVSTQRKARDYVNSLNDLDDDTRRRISSGLLNLLDQVLMIEDPYQGGTYHPRIAAKKTYAYTVLGERQREYFDRMYEDFFYHRNDELWRKKAMWKLPEIIDATGMLSCAEDLGMIPACVPEVMKKLEILSLEIERMPKDPNAEFADTAKYPYLSVCSTSTHDMPGIRRWWELDREKTQRFYNSVLGQSGEAPFYAEPWICREIISINLKSPSMFCILPLQDWLSIDPVIRREDPREEQINRPDDPHHYWCYRMHLTLGDLKSASRLNNEISHLIADAGR
ncbi:MAG: 4-alpha-glucanotransferase [Bacteroides sp.]|nr:4-alpha-glucanotransferase [Bacteroides sp.]MCM1413350.1 4-alpha-glucanotransferase [Bacteroides sp.]MCM1471964.1 4-alpha-glucanotransferase [Bacteroides sp.]